jgi:hypothetical protein
VFYVQSRINHSNRAVNSNIEEDAFEDRYFDEPIRRSLRFNINRLICRAHAKPYPRNHPGVDHRKTHLPAATKMSLKYLQRVGAIGDSGDRAHPELYDSYGRVRISAVLIKKFTRIKRLSSGMVRSGLSALSRAKILVVHTEKNASFGTRFYVRLNYDRIDDLLKNLPEWSAGLPDDDDRKICGQDLPPVTPAFPPGHEFTVPPRFPEKPVPKFKKFDPAKKTSVQSWRN